jgi:Flp pilus assembly protein TadG
MQIQHVTDRLMAAVLRFRDDTRAMMSMELVLVLPLLFWAVLGTVVFTDAYRARTQAQSAALHVADVISRKTDVLTEEYLEGMNDVFDFLLHRNLETRLRISSIAWDANTQSPQVLWSFGTRNLASLTELASANFADGSEDAGEADSFDFTNDTLQLPVADLAERIPPVFPGEALILVEAFTLWRSPIISWLGIDYLNNIRMTPIAVTRPRFSPFIRYVGDEGNFPPDGFEAEIASLPPAGEVDEPVTAVEEEVTEPAGTIVTIVDMDFSDGVTTGWSRTKVTHSNLPGIGSFLGNFSTGTRHNPVNFPIDLGGESSSALIEFDLFIIDSWDGYRPNVASPEGDGIILRINGSAIAFEAFDHQLTGERAVHANNRLSNAPRAEGLFRTTMTLVQHGTNLWGSHWDDQLWRVRIEVNNPDTTFTLGISGTMNEGMANESFGIANFRVTAVRGPHGASHFIPDPDLHFWQDPYTEFKMYAGCPTSGPAAASLRLRNSDLQPGQILRMLRRARGTTWLSQCPENISSIANRLASGTRTALLRYVNDTPNEDGNRLRIATSDGNNGFTCDSTLLIRDPQGQWHFNRRIQENHDHNARIDLGHASNGIYHIWVGTYELGECDTDLTYTKY